jgi:hypothetical protein
VGNLKPLQQRWWVGRLALEHSFQLRSFSNNTTMYVQRNNAASYAISANQAITISGSYRTT